MNINIENCLKQNLPKRLSWLGDQLVTHLRQFRDRCARGEIIAAVDEFFDCYRFSDNQCSSDWRKTKEIP